MRRRPCREDHAEDISEEQSEEEQSEEEQSEEASFTHVVAMNPSCQCIVS